jgi:CheY-like chemotaxis protein
VSEVNQTKKHRILVIDDNPAIHEDFRKILCNERGNSSELEATEAAFFGKTDELEGQSQFEVYSAHQGTEGLALVAHAEQNGEPFEIAFVDVRMPPGLDGIEITPRLWMADPNLQIVICTAYSDYTWEEIFAKIGASDKMFILMKPFDRMEVLQLAHTLIAKRQARSQAEADVKRTMQTRVQALEQMSLTLQSEIAALRKFASPPNEPGQGGTA